MGNIHKKVTKELYCQFLLAAQTNFTATDFSSHIDSVAHDAITRFLARTRTKRSQRTHIFCSILSFIALEKKRLEENISWYESKRRIISDALFLYLKQPIDMFRNKSIQ